MKTTSGKGKGRWKGGPGSWGLYPLYYVYCFVQLIPCFSRSCLVISILSILIYLLVLGLGRSWQGFYLLPGNQH